MSGLNDHSCSYEISCRKIYLDLRYDLTRVLGSCPLVAAGNLDVYQITICYQGARSCSPCPAVDQASADIVRTQLSDLSQKIHKTIQPVFVSQKPNRRL